MRITIRSAPEIRHPAFTVTTGPPSVAFPAPLKQCCSSPGMLKSDNQNIAVIYTLPGLVPHDFQHLLRRVAACTRAN